MNLLERLSPRVTVTIGMIFVALMMALVVWASSAFRMGLMGAH